MRTEKEKNHWSQPILGCVLALACCSAPQLKAQQIYNAPAGAASSLASCPAAPDNCTDDNVHMRIGIPLWAPGLHGDVTIGQHQGHVNKDFWDFAHHLDFIAALEMELRKSRFYMSADAFYVKSSDNIEARGIFAAPGSTAELTMKTLSGNIDLGYELVREPCYSLTVFGGARMTYLNPHLSISSPDFTTSRSTERFYGDPVIGLYGTYQVNDWFGVYVKGDVGGFGLLNDHLTWSVAPGAEFRPFQHMYVRAAWHWLGLDVVNRNNFNFDATLGGPQLELGYRF